MSIWDASRTSRQRNFDGFADAGTEPPEITFAAAPIGVAIAFVHIIHRDWDTEMVAATINRPRQRGSSAPAPGSKDRLQPAFLERLLLFLLFLQEIFSGGPLFLRRNPRSSAAWQTK